MRKPANSKLKQNEDEKHEKDCRADAKIDEVSHKRLNKKGEVKEKNCRTRKKKQEKQKLRESGVGRYT